MIDENFKEIDVVGRDADVALYKAQNNHMSIVLECVLKTTNRMRWTKKYLDTPWEIWRLHEEHQCSSITTAGITTTINQELANMKIADFPYPTKYLDTYGSKLEKFNEISPNKML